MRLVDELTGEVHDYRDDAARVVVSEIIAPPDAPSWVAVRSELWNRVERAEKRRDSQLAREVQLSLPHELSAAAQRDLVLSFVRHRFVSAGMVADVAVHAPQAADGSPTQSVADPLRTVDPRNVHAHVLLTMRRVAGEGFGPRVTEWNPSFRRVRGRALVADVSPLVGVREAWAHAVNLALERDGIEERVDHRSYVDRGIAMVPERKMGRHATALERDGVRTEAGDARRAAREHNARERERAQGQEAERGRSGPERNADASRPNHDRQGDRPQDDGAQSPLIAALNKIADAVRAREALAALQDALGLSRDGAAGIEYPDRRRWRSQRRAVLSEAYEKRMTQAVGPDWRVDRRDDKVVLTRGRDRVIDAGERITTGMGSRTEIDAILNVAESKGWKVVTPFGNDAFKRALMARALQRGLDVDAKGPDKKILAEVQAERERYVDRDRQRVVDAPVERDLVERGMAGDSREKEIADILEARIDGDLGRRGGTVAERSHELLEAVKERGPRASALERALAESLARLERGDGPTPATADGVMGTRDHAAAIVREVARMQSTFGAGDLERAARARAGSPLEYEAIMAAVKESPEIVQVSTDQRGRARFSARNLQDVERTLVDDGVALAAAPGFEVTPATLEGVLAARPFSEEQAAAIRHVTQPNRLANVVGLAGAGKSFTCDGVREVLEESGYSVRGTALSGIAAQNLEESSKIPSCTIAKLLLDLADDGERPARDALGPRDVLVIDEAGMVPARQMAEVLRYASEGGSKVILIGDFGQLQAIEAGAPFRTIVERVGAAELSEIRRQSKDWMKDATRAFARHNAPTALAAYESEGRVHGTDTMDDAKRDLVEKWAADRVAHPNETQLILTYRRNDVAELNVLARAIRRERGELGPDVEVDLEGEKMKLATNDRIYFRKNDKTLGVKNGLLGTVKAVDDKKVTVALDGEKPREVTFEFSKYPNIAPGLAGTVHTSQGVTVDRAYVLASSLFDRHLAYVGMTRHRHDVNLYWAKDAIRSRSQLDRVFSRRGDKETTLDYEIGSPRQAVPSIQYVRTPAQLRREVGEVLRTAAELRASEPGAASDRAYGEVVTWHRGLAEQLTSLERAGTLAVKVPVHAPDFASRIGAFERGIGAAAAAVVEVEASIAGPAQPAPLEMRANAVRALDADAFVEKANALLESSSYIDRTVALMALTGRRPSEVLKLGEIVRGFGDTMVFAGSAKTRDVDRSAQSYEIPVLGDRDKIAFAWAELRAQLAVPSKAAEVPLGDLSVSEINARVGKSIGASVRKHFGPDVLPKDLRGMYAAVAFDRLAPAEMTPPTYHASILNHSPGDVDTMLSYAKWTIAGKDAEGIAALERGRVDVIAGLRAEMSGADEALRGHLANRIARLEATRFELTVPKEKSFAVRDVVPHVRASLEARREALIAEIGTVVIESPITAAGRIKSEIQPLREQLAQAKSFTRSEVERMAVLEAAPATDRGAATELATIREAREQRVATATRELRDREAHFKQNDVRATLEAKFLEQRAAYDAQLAAVGELRAEFDAVQNDLVAIGAIEGALEIEGVGERDVLIGEGATLHGQVAILSGAVEMRERAVELASATLALEK